MACRPGLGASRSSFTGQALLQQVIMGGGGGLFVRLVQAVHVYGVGWQLLWPASMLLITIINGVVTVLNQVNTLGTPQFGVNAEGWSGRSMSHGERAGNNW